MKVVLLGPVVVPFREPLGVKYADPHRYTAAWRTVAERVPRVAVPFGDDEVVVDAAYPRAVVLAAGSRYKDTTTASLDLPAASIELDLPVELFAAAAGGDRFHHVIRSVRLTLHEHGIGLLRVDLDAEPVDDAAWDADAARVLEGETADIGEVVGAVACGPVLDAYLAAAAPVAVRGGLLDHVPEALDPTSEPRLPMWTSRSVVVAAGDLDLTGFLRAWLGRSLTDEDELAGLLDPDREPTNVTRWLNYAYVVPPDVIGDPTSVSAALDRSLRAIVYCQHLYGVLERCDDVLIQVLGESYLEAASGRLGGLRARLADAAERARMVQFEHARSLKLFDRALRDEAEAILDYWRLEEALVEPVERKAHAVQAKLDELAEARRERATLGTDIILLGIGVTSILGTLVALTQYGRTLATDPSMAGYREDSSWITYWVSGQATDGIILVSFVLSSLLIALFTFFRFRSR